MKVNAGSPQLQRQINTGDKSPFYSQARKDTVGPPGVTFRFVAVLMCAYSFYPNHHFQQSLLQTLIISLPTTFPVN